MGFKGWLALCAIQCNEGHSHVLPGVWPANHMKMSLGSGCDGRGASRSDASPGDPSTDQAHQKQHNEDEEQDLRNSGCGHIKARESEDSGHECNQ